MSREMKDSGISWVGKLPQTWDTAAIKRSFKIIAGATPISTTESFWDGDIPWVTPADFKTRDHYVSICRRNITKAGYDSCGTTLIPTGSILFSKRAPVGTVCINNVPMCTNQGCLSCVPYEGTSSNYFYYTMSVYTEQFELVSAGTTFKEISADTFANFVLPLPPYNEQQKISDFLDVQCTSIDSVLGRTRASIEEYKKLKQAVITQAVTKGIRGKRPMKDSQNKRWNYIPEDWSFRRVKSCVTEIKSGLSAVTEDDAAEDSGFFVLRTSAVSTGVFIPTEVKPVLSTAIDRLICPVKKGTLIVSRMNTAAMVGMCAYVGDEYPNIFLPDKLWRIQVNESENAKFLWYSINATPAHSWFCELATGASASMQNITISDFSNNYIALPDKAEQDEIVNYLDRTCSEIDTLIAKKEQYLVELENYKRSLIYEYVTGKREVPSRAESL